MPVFKYEAMDSKGKKVSGELEADSRADLTERLREIGLFPTSMEPVAFELVQQGPRKKRKNIIGILLTAFLALPVVLLFACIALSSMLGDVKKVERFANRSKDNQDKRARVQEEVTPDPSREDSSATTTPPQEAKEKRSEPKEIKEPQGIKKTNPVAAQESKPKNKGPRGRVVGVKKINGRTFAIYENGEEEELGGLSSSNGSGSGDGVRDTLGVHPGAHLYDKDFSWSVVEKNSVFIKVSWNATIRNNMNKSLDFHLNAQFFNSSNFLIHTDTQYRKSVVAYSESTFSGSTLISAKHSSSIESMRLKLDFIRK